MISLPPPPFTLVKFNGTTAFLKKKIQCQTAGCTFGKYCIFFCITHLGLAKRSTDSCLSNSQ